MSFEEYNADLPDHLAAIQCLMDELCWPGDMFSQNPNIKKIYKFDALATHPDYRGQGLATKLVKQAFTVAKKSKCDGATVLATNDYTRKIFNKIGMEVVASKQWKDCIFGGKRLFKDVKSEMVTSHFIKLEQD